MRICRTVPVRAMQIFTLPVVICSGDGATNKPTATHSCFATSNPLTQLYLYLYCTMLLGVGIDILSLTRFGVVLSRRTPPVVAKRICSPAEYKRFQSLFPSSPVNHRSGPDDRILRYLSTRSVTTLVLQPIQDLLYRWVLKEAAYKALSAHVPVGLTWKSLHVDHLPSGQPTIRFIADDTTTGRSATMQGMEVDLMCTISHDAGVVVGVVIAQTKG